MSHVTQLLAKIDRGDSGAAAELLPLVYQELRELAATRLARENPGQTLQATALVHEAFLRLLGPDGSKKQASADSRAPKDADSASLPRAPVSFDSRGHFFAAAAEAMRRILVDRARQKNAAKRGGDFQRVDLEPDLVAAPEVQEDLVALDAALDQLAATYPEQAEVVKLRYFAGLTLPDAAAALGISERTAGRHWAFARAWLRRAVETGQEKNS
ncbi:MAG: sigma-70 family RNA polymerase sigma factor [Pirellulaceae bacterium]|jgi:RNA polymerase sigma factor (sigma-70 family)|nr:sigma-70 family RNA polymerase sigma factor [Pirellulaceae bacterium]